MKQEYTYPVVIHKSQYGCDIHVPSLPGCHSQGETDTEALANIEDAIRVFLQSERNDLSGADVREVTVSLSR